MKILQRVFSTIVLLSFIFVAVSPVDAAINVGNGHVRFDSGTGVEDSEDYLTKQVITSKVNLKKIRTGDKYVKKIDKIIEKVKTNRGVLKKLQGKIYEAQDKLYSVPKNAKTNKAIAILDYIEVKVNLELYRLSLKEAEEAEKKINQKLEEMKTSSLSESEKKEVSEKLVNIQLNLLENASDKINTLVKDFDKLSNYEEKGDFKFNFNLDHELVGKIKTNLELNNYKSKVSGFDSQFSGQLKALVDAAPKGEEALKFQINSFMDFIAKDGNMYVLLNKLNITDEVGIEKIKYALDTLKKIAEKNKYIKFEDKNTAKVLETLKSLNPSKILSDSREILSEPMFEAYKKQENKYYLKPTKYACDKFKELSAKFDPWNGSNCSKSQYKDMLKSLAESGDLYIEVGSHKNKLGFDMYAEDDIKSFNSYVIFTDTSIDEVKSELIIKDGDEGFKLEYVKNNKLDFNLDAGENANIKFNSKLDKNNEFTYIDSSIDTKGWRDEFNATLKLENKKITGDFTYTDEKYDSYDYNTGKSIYKPGNKIIGKLTGKQDYNGKIQDLSLEVSGTDLETEKNFLEAKFTKNSDNYTAKFKISEDEKEVIDMDLKLQNKKISGYTKIFDRKGAEYLNVTHSGRYEKDYFELNNNFELSESLTDMYSGQTSKARDTIRKNELRNIQYGMEYYYMENEEYPVTIVGNEGLKQYLLSETPKDPSGNIEINGCKFGYYYEVGYGKYGIENNQYRISSCLENGEKIYLGAFDKDNFKASEEFYINGYTTWTKTEAEKEDNTKAQADINIMIDVRSNKNNANIYIDYIEGNDKTLEIEIDNEGTIEYKKVEIESPTDTMKIQEALGIGNNY